MTEQAFAAFLMSYLRAFGLDKSAADDIATAGMYALRFANATIAEHGETYDPEFWDAMGEQKAQLDMSNEVSPSLSHIGELLEL